MKVKYLLTDKKGVTLIELLIVVTIISILSGIGIPLFLRAHDQAKDKKLISEMRIIAIALGTYSIDYEVVPDTTDFAELAAILEASQRIAIPEHDSWGHTFYYRRASARDEYTLKSFGKDGIEGDPAITEYFDPDADTIVITGVFVASHEGTLKILK
jgi:general secretion pathway protein G